MRNQTIDLLARQWDTFSFEDALNITGLSRESLKKLIYRLERNGWIERIEKGKYMIIPLGTEKGKYTLHEFILGSVLVTPYCISYWTALHYHGLTEQIPSTVFIQTTAKKKKQEQEVFGVNYRIVRIKKEKMFGISRIRIDETSVNITDKEKTIVDCLDKPNYSGGIVEVAKALNNEELDNERLRTYSENIRNSGVLRRLGYLSDTLGLDMQLPRIDTRNYLYLDPTMSKKGPKNSRWKLVINLDEKVLGELE